MRIIGSDKNLKTVDVDGKTINQQKDGTFHTDQYTAKKLVSSGDFAIAGISLHNAKGHICNKCGFNNVFRDKCGRCGCTELTPEE
jgi:ribosomal protein L40E